MNQLELNLEPILYTHETKELLALVKARSSTIEETTWEYNHGTYDHGKRGKLSQAQIDMMGAEQACLWHVRQKLERMLNQ
tara:strand:+ start:14 stop:253 length:240 start_codon:yes stop_codon:yes gene_type:complete